MRNSAAKNITAKGLVVEVMKPWRNTFIGVPAPAATVSVPLDLKKGAKLLVTYGIIEHLNPHLLDPIVKSLKTWNPS